MLKGTLNLSPPLIRTKNLYSDGDELSVVDCSDILTLQVIVANVAKHWKLMLDFFPITDLKVFSWSNVIQ